MERYIKYALASLPIIVGLLYLAGIVFDGSYFGYWGLDSDQFSRSVNDTIVRGVFALIIITSKIILELSALAFLAFFLFLFVNLALFWMHHKSKIKAAKLTTSDLNGNMIVSREELLRGSPKSPVEQFFGTISAVSGVFIVLVVLLAFLVSFLSKAGADSAKNKHDLLSTDSWNHGSKYDVQISGNNIPAKARRMISCAGSICVFLTEDGVETFKTGDIDYMKTFVKH